MLRKEKEKERSLPSWKRPVKSSLSARLALGALLIWGLGAVARGFSHESTDDSFIAADIVSISPKVSGEVTKVFVKDNQEVKTGDPLVQIDQRDFDAAVAQKKAALATANANTNVIASTFKLLAVQIETAKATAQQSAAQEAADRANAEKAASDLKRAQDLIERKIIAPQEFDTAKAAADAAASTLKGQRSQNPASDRSRIDEAEAEFEAGRAAYDRAVAQAKQADVDVSLADLNRSYTTIAAPVDGRITRKAVEQGDYIQVSQRLMAIVPTNIWVVANFKETQLQKIRTNQSVEIFVDSVKGRTFPGRVQSIQAGSGAAFSLLPPENAVGNYVKVVQRVPVKIVFDNPVEVEHVLGPGMSAEPSVQVSKPIPKIVVMITAIMLTLVIGFFWWRAATKKPVA